VTASFETFGDAHAMGGDGGRGGIRTHGRVAPTSDFESGAFNRSATLPLVRGGVVAQTVADEDHNRGEASCNPHSWQCEVG